MNSDTQAHKAVDGNAKNNRGPRGSRWRITTWSLAALILLLPLLAMQFTDEVDWDLADFVIAGALLLGSGLTYELVARKMNSIAYRAAAGIAIATALLMVWMNLAVGIIGSEDNAANLIYVGVLTVGLIGSLIARFQARGMARTLFAMALALMLVALIALLAGLGFPENSPLQILAPHGFFVALFGVSALLFRKAAREGPDPRHMLQPPI